MLRYILLFIFSFSFSLYGLDLGKIVIRFGDNEYILNKASGSEVGAVLYNRRGKYKLIIGGGDRDQKIEFTVTMVFPKLLNTKMSVSTKDAASSSDKLITVLIKTDRGGFFAIPYERKKKIKKFDKKRLRLMIEEKVFKNSFGFGTKAKANIVPIFGAKGLSRVEGTISGTLKRSGTEEYYPFVIEFNLEVEKP